MNMTQFQLSFTADMINQAPADKRAGLSRAVDRTFFFTSDTHMYCTVEVFIEGWYIVCDGCQTRWAMWVVDDDGVFVYGHRKPRNPRKLYSHRVDWYDLEDLIKDRVYSL